MNIVLQKGLKDYSLVTDFILWFAMFNGLFFLFCCPLNLPLNRLIGLKPILSVIQLVIIYTMLNKNGPF